ncbi:MAG: GHMP kinase [Candidatus Omnitrophica bacterium]|nr:GHMP kinase [Candidatus Omnitrophota bacterium]
MAERTHIGTDDLIVTRTPLRISFAGGGTDLAAFYEMEQGAVLSTAIRKYIYVTVKRHGALYGEPIRLNYSEAELTQDIASIKNDIIRECLRFLKVDPPIYVSTVADVPEFSGLGSSSSFAVGLLNALHVLKGERISASQLAEEASHIEIDVLRRPIGKQDHYAAAFGGLNFFCFNPDGSVAIEVQRIPEGVLSALFGHLLLFWTGIRRDASSILHEQKANTPGMRDELVSIRRHAHELHSILCNGFDPLKFGRVLDETWTLKRRLASKVTNGRIDSWYTQAKEAGAVGGKICGAGGGGFLLLVTPPDRRQSIRSALGDMTELKIGYEAHGSRLLMPFAQ